MLSLVRLERQHTKDSLHLIVSNSHNYSSFLINLKLKGQITGQIQRRRSPCACMDLIGRLVGSRTSIYAEYAEYSGSQAAQTHYMNADVTLACERCCVTNGYLLLKESKWTPK